MLTLKDVNKQKILGKGVSGSVYETRDGNYAFKEYFLHETDDDNNCYTSESLREVSYMETLKGAPHVQKIKQNIFNYETNGYFMKLYPETLSDRIYTTEKSKEEHIGVPLDPKLALKCLYQLTMAMYYANKSNIIHGDIRLENILIDKNDNIVLADWGHSQPLNYGNQLKPPFFIQALWYKAPENLLGVMPYDEKIDIWSIAVLYLELLLGHPIIMGDDSLMQFLKMTRLFGNPTNNEWDGVESLEEYIHYNSRNPFKNKKVSYPEFTDSKSMNKLLIQMLQYNPKNRPNYSEILNNKIFYPFSSREFNNPSILDKIKTLKLVEPKYKNLINKHNIINYRNKIINWMKRVAESLHLDFVSLNNAIIYLDHYFCNNLNENIQLIATASIYLSDFFTSIFSPVMDDMIIIIDNKYTEKEICDMSYKILSSLDYNIYIRTLTTYITYVLSYIEQLNINLIFDHNNIINILYNIEYSKLDQASLSLALLAFYNPEHFDFLYDVFKTIYPQITSKSYDEAIKFVESNIYG